MIVLTKQGGYGNTNLIEAKEVIDKCLKPGSMDKVILMELLYDYERMLDVIHGRNCIYQHEDGSQTCRIKLYN
jgi:hypothetical protein